MTKLVKKFPENQKIGSQITKANRLRIAAKTGYSQRYIREMLSGWCKMPDSVKAEAVKILEERAELDRRLAQLANAQDNPIINQ
ncbi:MAG: hypothetical protein PHG67_05990 [Bacteroidales bacterium]|jgi:DNA-binding transcriptional MerR regulator|nr:hypothetical protein [Bacteroidales bacterium]